MIPAVRHLHAGPPPRLAVLPLHLALTLLFTSWGAVPLDGQTDNVRVMVSQNILITRGDDEAPHVEPHLVANPEDPNNLIVAAMAVPGSGGRTNLRVYTSFDGGGSWNRQRLDVSEPPGVDPWLAFGRDSTVYLVSIAPEQVRRSTNGGRTWSLPTPLPRGDAGPYDYTKIVVDDTDGPFAGRVYVWASQAARLESGERVWPVALLRSSDRGSTFSWPEHVLPNNFNNQNGGFVVLSDGRIVASFHEITARGNFLRSPRLWVVRSSDGGASFSNPFLVAEQFSGDSPRLAVDRSGGAFEDRIYAAWSQYRPERGIYVSHSEDGGGAWSVPVRVDDHGFSEEADPPHGPMIAVSQNGTVGLTWQDPRHDPDGKCFTLYFTASVDGGATFLSSERVSTRISCPDAPRNRVPIADSDVTVARRWKDGGDYHGLAPRLGGGFQVVSADSRVGIFQLWTSRIDVVPAHER